MHKNRYPVVGLSTAIICFAIFCFCPASHADNHFTTENNVTWTSLGTNNADSMPIGNGDLAANVWTEQNGDLVLLIAKADAWTEWGKLVKLGRVRVQLYPNPFVGSTNFTQTLHVENGGVEIKSGKNTMQVWVDANHPVLHVEAKLEHPAVLEAKLELWRTAKPDKDGMFELSGPISLKTAADTVFPARYEQITWCHFNPSSIYPIVLKEEHLGSVVSKYADPLLHHSFGAAMTGPGLVSTNNLTLESAAPKKNLRLDLTALTKTNVDSPEAWLADCNSLVKRESHINFTKARAAHDKWWQDFWNRSWIHVSGTGDAEKVSQGYAMQRYMMACSSRGDFPVKFNGGLFTVGSSGDRPQKEHHSPDYRAWGNSYWNQNNRLLYWPLIETGDFDLLKPWFNMYVNALPLARDRTEIYFHHAGASFPETMLFWGLPNLNDFGWDNPSFEIKSTWQRYHIQGALEIIAQMLDEYDVTQNADFARKDIIPLADAVVTFYAEHWPRDKNGRIHMTPAQSLETYQVDAVNPTPDIVGLMSELPRILALPDNLTTADQRKKWEKILKDLPPLPMGKTVHGKLGNYGQGDPDGKTIILPAEKYGHPSNGENPASYVAFPYRLCGVGKPDLQLARDTFNARRFPQDTCWGQDGTEASILGLTSVAKKAAIAEFTHFGNQRFQWFWKPGHDWIPDFDNGGSGMITLQNMLMQCDGKRIQLLPAWPKDWNADFKLHAPFQTTVEGHVQNGKLSNLKVTPQSRASDVVVLNAQ